MGDTAKMKPEVIFKATKYHVTKTKNRIENNNAIKIKIEDREDIQSMKFKSYRDVSGLLVLISGKLKKICKA